jgi:hypothetical protein
MPPKPSRDTRAIRIPKDLFDRLCRLASKEKKSIQDLLRHWAETTLEIIQEPADEASVEENSVAAVTPENKNQTSASAPSTRTQAPEESTVPPTFGPVMHKDIRSAGAPGSRPAPSVPPPSEAKSAPRIPKSSPSPQAPLPDRQDVGSACLPPRMAAPNASLGQCKRAILSAEALAEIAGLEERRRDLSLLIDTTDPAGRVTLSLEYAEVTARIDALRRGG